MTGFGINIREEIRVMFIIEEIRAILPVHSSTSVAH